MKQLNYKKEKAVFTAFSFFLMFFLLSNCSHIYNWTASQKIAHVVECRILKFLQVAKITAFNKNVLPSSSIKLLISTFLGNETRNYYGNIAPEDSLFVLWKFDLGSGKTMIQNEEAIWFGAGWTGQPLLYEEDETVFIIQGAYDHNLRKINAENGQEVWRYPFDDVIKGTGTLWVNNKSQNAEEQLIILQGSRQGFENNLATFLIPSYRAISAKSGLEKWRFNSKRTDSYSRDVDGSALVINDTAYIGLENGFFMTFNPNCKNAFLKDGILQPQIFGEDSLFSPADMVQHGGNLVTESSPAKLKNHIYIASGSGHIFGFNMITKKIDWDFFIGSDIDGSVVVTNDNCLLVAVEKQYISGNGGVYKLNPAKPENDCVEWFFPVPDFKFELWEGGVIGSVGINDFYLNRYNYLSNNCFPQEDVFAVFPDALEMNGKVDVFNISNIGNYNSTNFNAEPLAAFFGINNTLYVVKHTKTIEGMLVTGTDGITQYPCPEIVFTYKTGPSISTPIFVGNKLFAATYKGLYFFEFDENYNFSLLQHIKQLGAIEATPIVHDRKLYIATRHGFLYCLGMKE